MRAVAALCLLCLLSAAPAAAETMNNTPEGLAPGLDAATLARIADQYGKGYYWQHMHVMHTAGDVVACIPKTLGGQVDADAFDAALAAFGASLEAFTAYCEITGEAGIRAMAHMPLPPDAFADFFAVARELAQDFREPEKPLTAHAHRINAMVSSYNTLVALSNHTRFLVNG